MVGRGRERGKAGAGPRSRVAAKLRELVEEQHPVVRERSLMSLEILAGPY
jgi:hypothetical protein